MRKTILITGATDGIGLETAKLLAAQGHRVLLHGRNPTKLAAAASTVAARAPGGRVDTYLADLSRMSEVEALAQAVADQHTSLDVLINNAGVYSAEDTITPAGLDVRFAVNTLAPYLLTRRLLPLLGDDGRVINLSSAAQAPVSTDALAGRIRLVDDFDAYAQSKLAITMWSRHLARKLGDGGPAIVSVNPGSMLGTKMVKDAFGVAGNDIRVGADILVRASLSEAFGSASGQYFDNDLGQFAPPHSDALDPAKTENIVRAIEAALS